jgi:hypothetical protein
MLRKLYAEVHGEGWLDVESVRRGGASGGSRGQQNGDAIDDGIAAAATGAEDNVAVCVEGEGLAADGTCEPAEIFRVESGLRRLGGHGSFYKVLVKME